MKTLENIQMAFKALRGNLLRAGLTMLIISFGILALVGILTAIDAILYSMSDSFSSLGANSFSIRPSNTEITTRSRGRVSKRAEPISFREAMQFKSEFDGAGVIAVSFTGKTGVVARYSEEESNPTLRIVGADENQLELYGMEIERGRYFNPNEISNARPVAVLGENIVRSLYGGKAEKAVGSYIRADGHKFLVVGTMEAQGGGLNPGSNADASIYVPLPRVRQLYGSQRTNYRVAVAAPQASLLEELTSEAIGTMRQVRRLRSFEPNDFEIRQSDDLINTIRENTVKIRLGTIAIGIMTIFGAAIGLMNIMLVSVTERTKEIGISKAIGANRNHILTQFLTEAIVICVLGGMFGIILGVLAGNIVTFFLGTPFIIPWLWMTLALVVCILVGLVSGLYPAIKASKLDPIDALRYE
jgi:putative ABC transport system permease protein